MQAKISIRLRLSASLTARRASSSVILRMQCNSWLQCPFWAAAGALSLAQVSSSLSDSNLSSWLPVAQSSAAILACGAAKLLLILLGLQKEFWSSYRHTGYWFLLCPVLGLYLQILGQVNAICMRSIICYVPKRKKVSACAQQLNQMLLLIQILKTPSLDWYCNIPNPNLNLWKLPSSTPFVWQLFMKHLFQLQQFALFLPNMIQINFSSSCVTNSCRAGQCSCSTMG